MNPRNRNILVAVIVVILIAVGGFFAFFNQSNSAKTKTSNDKTIKVGIMAGSKELDEVWKVVAKTAKDEYGITLKFTHFTDYTQPNTALQNGDVDVNAFQHYAFLEAWNKANKGNLKAIGDTLISPIRLYSKTVKSVSDIPDGATIAVPNDASNESRALYVLKNAGLIELNTEGNALATIKNIKSNPKKLVIKELDAAQTARSLDSAAGAVINDDFAKAAKLTANDSIFTEPVNKDSQKWINLIAVKEKDKDNALYKDLVKAYQTQATKDIIAKEYPDKGTIPAWGLKL